MTNHNAKMERTSRDMSMTLRSLLDIGSGLAYLHSLGVLLGAPVLGYWA